MTYRNGTTHIDNRGYHKQSLVRKQDGGNSNRCILWSRQNLQNRH